MFESVCLQKKTWFYSSLRGCFTLPVFFFRKLQCVCLNSGTFIHMEMPLLQRLMFYNLNEVCLILFTWQSIAMVPEDESVILSSFYNTMVSLSVKQGQCSFTVYYNLCQSTTLWFVCSFTVCYSLCQSTTLQSLCSFTVCYSLCQSKTLWSLCSFTVYYSFCQSTTLWSLCSFTKCYSLCQSTTLRSLCSFTMCYSLCQSTTLWALFSFTVLQPLSVYNTLASL